MEEGTTWFPLSSHCSGQKRDERRTEASWMTLEHIQPPLDVSVTTLFLIFLQEPGLEELLPATLG